VNGRSLFCVLSALFVFRFGSTFEPGTANADSNVNTNQGARIEKGERHVHESIEVSKNSEGC